MKKMIIYSKPNCGYCDRAKELLDLIGMVYEDRPLGTRYTADQLIEHCQHIEPNADVSTAPQMILVTDGVESYIGGYNQLVYLQEVL